MTTTLFDRLGGMGAIMAAVDIFYEKVAGDPLLADFFSGIDMPRLVRKQVAFMSWAFNGPDEYRGQDLRTAHRQLVASHGLGDVHFDAVAAHLKATLEELMVPAGVIGEVLHIVGGVRNEVLDR